MKNTFIEDNFEELMELSKEDREMVMNYFNNWTEQEPAYFDDGETLARKQMNLFREWLVKTYPTFTEKEVDDICDYLYDEFQDWASDFEYDVSTIVDTGNGVVDEDWFQDYYQEYLYGQE